MVRLLGNSHRSSRGGRVGRRRRSADAPAGADKGCALLTKPASTLIELVSIRAFTTLDFKAA